MTTTGWWLILLSAGFTASGNLLIRVGVDHVGEFRLTLRELPNSLRRLAAQPMFGIGFILNAIAALVWFRVVSTETLSTAFPLTVSLAFVFVTLGALVLFRESISVRKFAGLAVIAVGVFLVGLE